MKKFVKNLILYNFFICMTLGLNDVMAQTNDYIKVIGNTIDISGQSTILMSDLKSNCSGSIEYSTNTIILNSISCDLGSEEIKFLETHGNYTITLNGENNISGSGDQVLFSTGSLTINGNGSLNLIYSALDDADAMELTGTLTINSGYVYAAKQSGPDYQGGGMFVDGDIVVNGGTIIGSSQGAPGIMTYTYLGNGGLTVNDGQLQAYTTVNNGYALAVMANDVWTANGTEVVVPSNVQIIDTTLYYEKYYVAQNNNGTPTNLVVIQKPLLAPTIASQDSTQNSVEFSWNESTGSDGYIIYKLDTLGNYTQIAITTSDVRSYNDVNLHSNTEYEYQVVAYQTLINGSQLKSQPLNISAKTSNIDSTPTLTPTPTTSTSPSVSPEVSVAPSSSPTSSVVPTITPTSKPIDTTKPTSTPKSSVPVTQDQSNIYLTIGVLCVAAVILVLVVYLSKKNKK